LIDALVGLLSLPTSPSSGHVVPFDLATVGVDLSAVPMDETPAWAFATDDHLGGAFTAGERCSDSELCTTSALITFSLGFGAAQNGTCGVWLIAGRGDSDELMLVIPVMSEWWRFFPMISELTCKKCQAFMCLLVFMCLLACD
jgi:hypothetical protein